MHPQSSKPLLVYDNDCDFCRYWIAQWQHITGDRIDYAPSQEVAAEFPEIPLSAYENSVQLILQNGTVLSGAEAVFRALEQRFTASGATIICLDSQTYRRESTALLHSTVRFSLR